MKRYEVKKEFLERYQNMKYYGVEDEYESADLERVQYLQKHGYLGDEVIPKADDDDDNLDERLKKLGGGFYELPNGEKVRGKEKALEALKALDADGKNEPGPTE